MLQPYVCPCCNPNLPRCPEGESQENTGSTKCNACPAGTFDPAAPTEDPVSCTACPAGQFSTAARQLSCTPCAPGTFAARERTVTCEACPGGLFAASTGSTECEPCAAGRYAEDPGGQAVGASSCKRCASTLIHAVALRA